MIRDTNIFLRTYFQVLNALMSLPGLPYWFDRIAPQLLAGQTCSLLHTETVFEHCSYLEDVSADDIADVNIPTGIPAGTPSNGLDVISSEYLGDPDAIAAAIKGVAHQAITDNRAEYQDDLAILRAKRLALRAHGYADGFNHQRRQAAEASPTFARSRHRHGSLHSPFGRFAADHSLA